MNVHPSWASAAAAILFLMSIASPAAAGVPAADVISVDVSGKPGAYRFSVGVQSPDTGCGQYADWWEVLTADGRLLYRRILMHSHVGEQPFVRSGGPVSAEPDSHLIIRVHMNPGGYGGKAFTGSMSEGFKEFQPDPGFAAEVERDPPLPTGCAF